MKEAVKEELRILETQHPTRFQYLKLHLKDFINLLDEQEEYQEPFKQKQPQQEQQQILTQESSSRRKKRVREGKGEKNNEYTKRRRSSRSCAIRKAEACLRKIKTLKSFLSGMTENPEPDRKPLTRQISGRVKFLCSSNH